MFVPPHGTKTYFARSRNKQVNLGHRLSGRTQSFKSLLCTDSTNAIAHDSQRPFSPQSELNFYVSDLICRKRKASAVLCLWDAAEGLKSELNYVFSRTQTCQHRGVFSVHVTVK